MFNEVTYADNWNYCVSVASSYLSTNWKEHFFVEEEDANKFYDEMRQKHFAVLIVDKEGY